MEYNKLSQTEKGHADSVEGATHKHKEIKDAVKAGNDVSLVIKGIIGIVPTVGLLSWAAKRFK
jgi:hypothetical protein